jgi:4-diphosphocytidyl-2C-methyl-D-erythritol kinase
MALKKTVVSPQGFEAQDAYHKIDSVILRNKTYAEVVISSRKDVSSGVAFSSKVYECQYDLNGSNLLTQAYEQLKKLPEFTDAEDC